MTLQEKWKILEDIASVYADQDVEDGKHYWLHDFDLASDNHRHNWDILCGNMRYRGVLDPYEKYTTFWSTLAEVAEELKMPLHAQMARDVMDW